jgi:hypothetical protein
VGEDQFIEIDLTNFDFTLQHIGEAMTINPQWSVFPCAPRSKEPWPGLRWRDKSRPRSEWGAWPDEANVAIDCGKSGLVVLDEDEPGAVEKWLGYEPNTYTVSTGKGRHFYFYAGAAKIKNAVRLAPGVDIRAEGGYVVGAGSLHESGRRYAVVRDVPVSLLPHLPDDSDDDPDVVEIDLTGRPIDLPAMIPNGERNETLFKYACSLVGRKLRHEEALFLLRTAFDRCETPYTDEPPEGMWARALREYGQAQETERTKSWSRIDLDATIKGLQDGTIDRPTATIGKRTDGLALFYEGRVNGLYGDSTAGKTWTSLLACVQVMAHRSVVFIDFEDDEVGTVERLLALGVDSQTISSRFAYLRPEEKFSDAARARLLELVEEINPALVVIDSTGESMAVDGTKPNDDDDVARWVAALPKVVARRGPAVLLLDHLAKSHDGGLWPIGSQRKRAAITGAAYVQESVVGFDKNTAGHSRLRCSKDRRGGWSTGATVAELRVVPTEAGETVRVDLVEPIDREAVRSLKHTTMMAVICRAMVATHAEGTEFVSKRWVREAVPGTSARKDEALADLVEQGCVEQQSKGFRVVRPYQAVEQ